MGGPPGKFAYVSERNGPTAIWVRAEGWDRPLVTEFDFPSGSTRWFMTPALSPGADRVIYARVERDQSHSNWISSVSGGPPVRLTNTEKAVEEGGAWSLDGSRFAFIQNRNGVFSLMVVQTGGEATPTVLREKLGWDFLPQWSPDGRWIAFFERPPGKTIGGSWNLISPDGKTVRSLAAANGGEPTVAALTFSADSQRLYGIRPEQDHNYLFSIDIASDQEKIIGDVGKDFTPNSYLSPGVRLSLSPDGKSLLFPSFRSNYSLWMLEGFDLPGWAMQLRERLPW